jgi:hypothetical protein
MEWNKMTRTSAINTFLTTFDQSTQTTAEQILAVGRFFDAAFAQGMIAATDARETARRQLLATMEENT